MLSLGILREHIARVAENLRQALLVDGNGVLVMRAETAVFGNDGPAVFQLGNMD